MVEQVSNSSRNVIDFLRYKKVREADAAVMAVTAAVLGAAGAGKLVMGKFCRHCGAVMMDGESDDDCSSVAASLTAPRMFCAD